MSVIGAVMQLNVLYFAHVRERVGRSAETLVLPDDSTAAEAVAFLVRRYPELETLMRVTRVAVDGEFVSLDVTLRDGAEFVLIPPVAGGCGLAPVAIGEDILDEARQRSLESYVADDRHGAVVTFVGAVRNHARGKSVSRLFYEAYQTMALAQLKLIVDQVHDEIAGTRIAVHHRVGELGIGDVAVIVAVGSAHRGEAFAACQRVIDRLKEDVPIWKREVSPDGAEWISDRP